MSNIPKLRFPEFSGEWEEKKIIQFCEISAGGDIDKNNSQKEFSSSYPYSVYSNSLENKGLYGYANYYKIDSDVVTVTGRGDVGHAVARHEKFVPIVRLLVCKPKNNENVDFLENAINKTKIFIESTGVPQLTAPQLGNVKLFLPSLAEQQKIAEFLSNVDSIITAETKILNTLQKKKKALMQKLFTRQLRFKSDDGTDFPAWEEKKLGECVEILDSQRKPIESKERANRKGEYPYYGASGIIDYIDDYLFEGESILLGEDGANIINRNSRLAFIATGKYWVNNHAHIMKANADNLNYFICEYLESLDYSKICAGSAQPKLTQDVIRNLTIKAPCKAEQQKIADCLSSIDSLIQTQQKVVTTWQQRKKALLQQMFI